MAKRWQIKRLAQDELTLSSHQRLDAAYKNGFFDDLISPYRGLARDNNLRADASLEKLASLAPAYDRQNGTLTAGNSTPLTDGASVVLLASEEWAAARGLPVLAYLRTGETAAVNFVDGSEGLLMAPAYAVPRMLAREGLSFADFDFSRSTKPSPPRCCAPSRPGKTSTTAVSAWGWKRRWGQSSEPR